MRRSRLSRSGWPLLVAILIAAATRLITADYSLWFDDLASLFYASQPFGRLWSPWMVRETTPPLFYSILHGWIAAFGWAPVTVRLPSIIASLAAIAIVFAGVRAQFGTKAAAFAAVLLAVSPQQLLFAHQVRAYILLFAAVAISYYGILAVAREERRSLKAWGYYVSGAIAAVYLHTTACLWPLSASLALILSDRRFLPFKGARWIELALANAVILVAGGWWLTIVVMQTRILAGNIGWIAPPDFARLPAFLLRATLLEWEPAGFRLIAPLILVALCVHAVVSGWEDRRVRFTLACYVIATALFFAVSLRQPIMLDRTVIWLTLFPLTLSAASLRTTKHAVFSTVALVVAALLLAWGTGQTIPKLQKEDWRRPVRIASSKANAIVLVDGEAMVAAMTMACRSELGTASCPFRIAATMIPGKMMDRWADCYGSDPRLHFEDAASVASSSLYTYSRWAHDPLDELHQRGAWGAFVNNPQSFVGPIPGSHLAELATRFPMEGGLIWLHPAGRRREAEAEAAQRARAETCSVLARDWPAASSG